MNFRKFIRLILGRNTTEGIMSRFTSAIAELRELEAEENTAAETARKAMQDAHARSIECKFKANQASNAAAKIENLFS